MKTNKIIIAGVAALSFAASSTLAMAQQTGTENNATSGSSPGAGPKSGMEVKGNPNGTMPGGSATSTDNMPGGKTSAGTQNNQVKDLRGHSETPTTGK